MRRRRGMGFENGPYVQVACFCEMVIEDKTGPLSLIRIIDTLIHTEVGTPPPQEMPPFLHQLKLVLMLKSGMVERRHDLVIVPELPSGETEKAMNFTIHLEEEEKGQNIVVTVAFTFEFEGLYWFRVYFDNEKLTAIPIRVRYNRVTTGS
jgi:hypothetical protein